MCLPLNFLKIAVFVSGFLILIYFVLFIGVTSWISALLLSSLDGHSDGLIGIFIIFLWCLCAMVWSMVYCAFKGAKTDNKNLLCNLIVGCFFHLVLDIVILKLTREVLVVTIITTIFIIMFLIIMIILLCYVSHPKNEKKYGKFRSSIYDQDAHNQYLEQLNN